MRSTAALAIALREPARQALSVLAPYCEIVEAEETAEAVALLSGRRFSVIFMDGESGKFSPADLDLLRVAALGIPKAVVGTKTDSSVLATLSEDPEFRLLMLDPAANDLEQEAKRILFPRSAERRSFVRSGFRVSGTVAGRSFDHPLIDLSNTGLSFGVVPGESIEGLITAGCIENLRIADRSGETLLETRRATVRNCRPDATLTPTLLRVGVAFSVERSAGAPHVRLLEDPLRISATLRRACRSAGDFIVSLPDEEAGFLFDRAEVIEGAETVLKLLGRHPTLASRDVVRLSFNHYGLSYSGLASVTEAGDAVVLAPPRTLRVHHRRGSNRHIPTKDRRYWVRLRSRLAEIDQVFEVNDINATGLSARVDGSENVLPAGLVLDLVELHLPDGGEPVRARGRVRSIQPLPLRLDAPGKTPLRCGIELFDLEEEDRARLLHSLVAAGFCEVEPAGEEEFDALWDFLAEAKFNFHLYADGSDEHREIARRGFGSFGRTKRSVGVNLVYRTEGKIHGHITGIRFYSRNWLLTHMAAVQTTPAAPAARISRALAQVLGEHLENQPEAEFVKFMWKTDQRWMNRFVGWTARAVHQEGLSELQEFSLMVRPNALPPPHAVPGVEIHDADPRQLREIAAHLAMHTSALRVHSDDLSEAELLMPSAEAAYREHGLMRRRRVIAATVNGRLVGYGLLEEASPAIHLAEAVNGFDVFCLDDLDPALQRKVESALIRDAVVRYSARGLSHSIARARPATCSSFQESGFIVAGESRSWTWHVSLVRAWTDLWDEIHHRGHRFYLGAKDS